VLHESATGRLADLPADGDLLLVVGPEGGISDEELAVLTDAGAIAVRLGPSVLRASTAAAVALGSDWRPLYPMGLTRAIKMAGASIRYGAKP